MYILLSYKLISFVTFCTINLRQTRFRRIWLISLVIRTGLSLASVRFIEDLSVFSVRNLRLHCFYLLWCEYSELADALLSLSQLMIWKFFRICFSFKTYKTCPCTQISDDWNLFRFETFPVTSTKQFETIVTFTFNRTHLESLVEVIKFLSLKRKKSIFSGLAFLDYRTNHTHHVQIAFKEAWKQKKKQVLLFGIFKSSINDGLVW